MGNVFISYRREDSAAYAGRLCDHLNNLVGADHVFMDVEDIAPGQRFEQAIDETMARCDAALIVIGPRWAEILRQRAQEQQRDYVCHEIEAALARQITIVPVLVGGAGMAQLAGLPGTLSTLSQYEAAELRDSTFSEDCGRLAKALRLQPVAPAGVAHKRAGLRKIVAIVAGSVLLLTLLFFVSGWIGIGPWSEYRARRAALDQMFATARTQSERTEYESAFRTYQSLLKTDPANRTAMELQVDAAMGWLENFRVAAPEGGKAEDVAAGLLAEMAPVLDAGLARTNGQGPRAADILAHMGWLHWLNQHIAYREFGPAAERDLRQALRVDPSNVYAHGMLANWMMQTGRRTEEALDHFRIAIESNKARPFVRRLQLGAMIYPRNTETRVALIRVANEMRRNGESLEEGQRRRILTAYNPTVNSAEELTQTLSAVPPADAWATWLWLSEHAVDGTGREGQRLQRDFIQANILEIGGKRQEALAAFEKLRSELKQGGYNGRIVTHVQNAITRRSKS
jgi:tetratricopeptide (TPR) repeat protein